MAACEHFNDVFTGEDKLFNEDNLECIPRMISQEQNARLTSILCMDKLMNVVFKINPNSAAGPYYKNVYLFVKC